MEVYCWEVEEGVGTKEGVFVAAAEGKVMEGKGLDLEEDEVRDAGAVRKVGIQKTGETVMGVEVKAGLVKGGVVKVVTPDLAGLEEVRTADSTHQASQRFDY